MAEVLVLRRATDGAVTQGHHRAADARPPARRAARRRAGGAGPTTRPPALAEYGADRRTSPRREASPTTCVVPKADVLAAGRRPELPGRGARAVHHRGQGDRRPAGGPSRLGPHHRRRRRRPAGRDLVATQCVFGGVHVVESRVIKGTPVITVRARLRSPRSRPRRRPVERASRSPLALAPAKRTAPHARGRADRLAPS